MQQPWLQIEQFGQLVRIAWIILIVALREIRQFTRVGNEYLVPAPLYQFGHPPRLPAPSKATRLRRMLVK
jgi:hypothetical protein